VNFPFFASKKQQQHFSVRIFYSTQLLVILPPPNQSPAWKRWFQFRRFIYNINFWAYSQMTVPSHSKFHSLIASGDLRHFLLSSRLLFSHAIPKLTFWLIVG
jgi:hypothetical protein